MLQPLWKNFGISKIRIAIYIAISLLGIHSKELKVGSPRGICTPMFIATLLTQAKIWKQSKCPSTNEYTYNGILFSLKKAGNSDW